MKKSSLMHVMLQAIVLGLLLSCNNFARSGHMPDPSQQGYTTAQGENNDSNTPNNSTNNNNSQLNAVTNNNNANSNNGNSNSIANNSMNNSSNSAANNNPNNSANNNANSSNASNSENGAITNIDNTNSTNNDGSTEIHMKNIGGVYQITALINGEPVQFIFDTGASDVTISDVEAAFLYKQGKLTDSNFIGKTQYQVANGDYGEGDHIFFDNFTVGGLTLHHVEATIIHNPHVDCLLGESFLSKLGKVTIDYKNSTITLK